MTSKQPLVSVIIPVYNVGSYVRDAILSVTSQTYTNLEIIVVDDMSTDVTWETICDISMSDTRIKVFRNSEHRMITKSLNFGIKQASGKYIARMDGDDWSYPDRIAKQVAFMEANEEVGLLGAAIEVCDENLNVLNIRRYPLSDPEVRGVIFRFSPFAHPVTMWRKDIMIKAGLYNEDLPLSQDYELYFRVGKVTKLANLDQVLLKLRTRSKSSSMSKGRQQELIAISTRMKAATELGYKMTLNDKIYTLGQFLSVFLIPRSVKFWLFNFLRKSN